MEEINQKEVEVKVEEPKVNPLHESFMKRTVKERDSRKRLENETLDEYHYRQKIMKKMVKNYLRGRELYRPKMKEKK